MANFITKEIGVRAIELTTKNKKEIIEFVGGEDTFKEKDFSFETVNFKMVDTIVGSTDNALYVPYIEGPLLGLPGDFLVEYQGMFYILKREIFNSIYEKVGK